MVRTYKIKGRTQDRDVLILVAMVKIFEPYQGTCRYMLSRVGTYVCTRSAVKI